MVLKKKRKTTVASEPAEAEAEATAEPFEAPPTPKSEPAPAPAREKAPKWRPPSQEEKEKAEEEAIAMIRKGLQDNPDAQKNGQPYIPEDWVRKMKPILGGYKKFVENSPHFFVKHGDLPAQYTVHVQAEGNHGKKKLVETKPAWELEMQKVWMSYCRATAKEKRSAVAFADKARDVARYTAAPDKGETKGHVKEKKRKAEAGAEPEGKKKKKKKTA
mmetsp:Transcript_22285/g.49310  ORF Transcript_22285/g.49310 Transcript_22285/m.49310 type:complete len:217 (-) Transcript_22285:50-700(-)